MIKVKTFRKHWSSEELLGRDVEYFLNYEHLSNEDVIINYTANDKWIYCMITWEDKR